MSDAVANFAQAIVALSPNDRAIAVLTWDLGYSSFDLPGGIDPPTDAQWTDRCEWAIANDFLPWTDTGTVRYQPDRVVFRLTTSLVQNGHNIGSDGAQRRSGGRATLRSMHAARHQIVPDLVQSVSDGSGEDICLVGGSLRSMSDIIREFLRALQDRPSVDNPTLRLGKSRSASSDDGRFLRPGVLKFFGLSTWVGSRNLDASALLVSSNGSSTQTRSD